MCKATGGSGEIAILDEPEVTSVQDRVRGFKMGIAQKCPNVKIVADVDSGGTRDKANSDMSDILQAHKNLKGVFGVNDDSALGAVTAVRAAAATNIAVVGYDATAEARTAIKNGNMYGDAIQYPDKIGALTIDAIHDYFTGKNVPARIDSSGRHVHQGERVEVIGRPPYTAARDARHREDLSRCSRARRRDARSLRG